MRAQREAMATMGELEHRPDLIKLSHTLMAVLGTVYEVALAAALEWQVSGGGGAGGVAGLRVG